jgi:type III pantothenate kinase
MFLSCDIGNSTSVFGIFDGDKEVKAYKVSTAKMTSVDEIKFLLYNLFLTDGINLKELNNACISSVVPSLNKIYEDFFYSIGCKFIFISFLSQTGINICVDNPEKLGSDRIVNISYAYHLSKEFQIIIDIGTAITIDIIEENGNFPGGVIFPGMKILTDCLKEKTESLPLIDIEKPSFLIGTNTISSIESGLYYGTVFLIEGFIEAIYKLYKIKTSKIIFTGGMAKLIGESVRIKGAKHIDEMWIIKGLKFLYDLNLPS